MRLCQNKLTKELLAVVIESKPINAFTRTLNTAMREDGSYVAICDDDLEDIECIELTEDIKELPLKEDSKEEGE